MAATYKPVTWNRQKRTYDLIVWFAVALYVGIFFAVASTTKDSAGTNPEILIIGALGACAFFMLHVILVIGPLARLSPLFLPLLYNRRHLGVSFFLVALGHAAFATIWYHGGGVLNPIVSFFVSNPRYDSLDAFPFESLGAAALLIFFVMAATSHDFWLKNLSAAAWKTLHMFVYAAYALVVLHVLLGAASSPLYIARTALGFAVVAGLHLTAAVVQLRRDGRARTLLVNGWIDLGRALDIPENRARIVAPPQGEAIAVFRYDGKIAAVGNDCPHQMGPLGEGRILNGCIVCPWHGRQFKPDDGQPLESDTPPVATFNVRIVGSRVYVDPRPNPPGAKVEPARIA